jgi:uncharacterized protein (TIGR02246 family)
MRRPHLLVMALLCVGLGVSVAAEDIDQTIAANNAGLVADLLRGDATAVAARYTNDAVVIPPNGEPATGTAAIEAFWSAAIEAGIEDVELTTIRVEASGDLACEDGDVSITTADGKTTRQRYLVVWKRVGGEWKLHRDIWN